MTSFCIEDDAAGYGGEMGVAIMAFEWQLWPKRKSTKSIELRCKTKLEFRSFSKHMQSSGISRGPDFSDMAIGRTSKRRKVLQKTEKDSSGIYYKAAVICLALGFGFLHRWHVSTLFENARHFSHLSEIEREMSFRTEMGMYYSYYKTIANSKNFIDGLTRINNDNLSEYPNVINAEAKYNLFPEVMTGLLYHAGKSLGIITKQHCWQIERGEGLLPVTSCEGLAVPIYFYLEVVWYFASATGVVLFLYGTYLSGTVYGGLIAILSYFYNHTECTRVQWTPPLRESFAYPALLYQMYKVTTIIDKYQTKAGKEQLAWREILINGRYIDLLAITAISLHSWQFSQFVLTTQLIALMILVWLKIIPRDLFTKLSALHAIPVAVIIFATRSNLLLYSLYTCLLVSTNYSIFITSCKERGTSTKALVFWEIVGSIGMTVILKHIVAAFDDDGHIFNLLRTKLTSYKDFHTLLYTCSAEFDFLQYETYEAIISTLLLPTAILAGFLAIYYWYRNYQTVGYPNCIEAAVAYNALQTGAFIIMAFFIMRLKLFMTPQLCVIAGLASSKRYLDKVGIKGENMRAAIVVLLIAGMSYHGIRRLEEEHDFIGEYSNIEQEELFEWIKASTPKTAVFAGKMSLMANIMLSTERPIINNPYYENKEMRDRTLKVYEIYSRKDAVTVYDTLRKMQVDYVVLEEGLCYGLGNVPSGCRMVDLWDLTDDNKSKLAGKRPLCPILFRGNAHPFRRVFVNRKYVVLRLDYSTYVELKPSPPVLLQSW